MKKNTKTVITNFLAAFFVIFGFSFATVSFVQAVMTPSSESSSNINDEDGTQEKEVVKKSQPERVIISKIGVDQPILNPSSSDPVILDQNLLQGVVRYPDSGLLGEKKNMFLFGHSTSFKVVQNQAFKAFNRLGELKMGDEILVTSENEVHIYKVRISKQVSANEALVEFSPKKTLTLVTCNTFGRKEDRYMVEADFIRSYELSDQI